METKELTGKNYRELKKELSQLFETYGTMRMTCPETEDEKSASQRCEEIEAEFKRYEEHASDLISKLIVLPALNKNLLHGINRITNQKFENLHLIVEGATSFKGWTDWEFYSGELNQFIRKLKAEIRGSFPLDPDYQRHHMDFSVHISYVHTSGGSNGCDAESKLILSLHDLSSYLINLEKNPDFPVKIG